MPGFSACFPRPHWLNSRFQFQISDLAVGGGESGIGSGLIQPIQTVAESLSGRFPFDVSSIIAGPEGVHPLPFKQPGQAKSRSHAPLGARIFIFVNRPQSLLLLLRWAAL